MRRRNGWIVRASILAASLILSSVAVATGSVVSTVIGAGSMPNGVGFAATPDMNTVVAGQGGTELVHRLAHTPGEDGAKRNLGSVPTQRS